MAPVNDETDEGFVSPSVQRIGLSLKNPCEAKARLSESDSASENGSQTESLSSSSSSSTSSSSTTSSSGSSQEIKDTTTHTDETPSSNNKPSEKAEKRNSNGASNGNTTSSNVNIISGNPLKDAVESKAESLARFVVYTVLGKDNGETSDKVERTLLRCVRMMMQKHEYLFKGMMQRLKVTRETGYLSFVTVANTLFEDEKLIVTWSRIVALYAFGGQLALYCKEKDMEDLSYKIQFYLAKYAKEVLTPYVTSIGGWGKICEEFPEDTDIENKIRRVLSWTAVGLGVAATLSYLTSR